MYLLGKFLKLRYYHLLLDGNPRKVYARAADLDRHLESAQALLAGLNPPKDDWFWSTTNELNAWQPKAVHSTATEYDDLLSAEYNCFKLEQDKIIWKNSTKYQQLLNEFRHDLQTLRANTGLEFEDDLEMLSDIEDALRTRKAFKENVPAWYTSTFANRLGHIVDVTSESRFNSASVQRLYVGRLLHEIAQKINTKILIHQQMLASKDDGRQEFFDDSGLLVKQNPQLIDQQQQQQQLSLNAGKTNSIQMALNEPNINIYITDKQRLAALMNSLQIYTSEPRFGSLLIIELHFDPINRFHFLRLFTISSSSPNSFPEPLRVNPIACIDSVECLPQQFEQNIRHLMLDKGSWQEACLNSGNPSNSVTTTAAPLQPLINDDLSNQPLQNEIHSASGTPSIAPIELDATDAPTSTNTTASAEVDSKLEQVTPNADESEEAITVGPIKEVTPDVDESVTGAGLDFIGMNNSIQSESESTTTSVIVEDSSAIDSVNLKQTNNSREDKSMETSAGKKQDISSGIEFQSFPDNSLSETVDKKENNFDEPDGGQGLPKVAERENSEDNYNDKSDI